MATALPSGDTGSMVKTRRSRTVAHLVKNRIQYDFDAVISVQDVGVFKPGQASGSVPIT